MIRLETMKANALIGLKEAVDSAVATMEAQRPLSSILDDDDDW